MKSDLIQTVAPPPQEIAAPNATSNADLRNQAEQTSSSSALSRVTTNGTTETEKSSTLAAGSANIAATGSDSFGDAGVTSSQRIALSRSRLEAMMLEAQAASSSADAQRARAIARAVKMEAGAIRDVLRNAADTDAALAAAAAARAAEDAQIEAQRAVAAPSRRPTIAPAWRRGAALAPYEQPSLQKRRPWARRPRTCTVARSKRCAGRRRFSTCSRALNQMTAPILLRTALPPLAERRYSIKLRPRTVRCWMAGTCWPDSQPSPATARETKKKKESARREIPRCGYWRLSSRHGRFGQTVAPASNRSNCIRIGQQTQDR